MMVQQIDDFLEVVAIHLSAHGMDDTVACTQEIRGFITTVSAQDR